MHLLVLSSNPQIADLVEQAALSADIGPFEIDAHPAPPADFPQPCPYAAIVVEHGLTAMEDLREIRRFRGVRNQDLPVVVVLPSRDGALITRALEAGAADVISGSFAPIEFERRVRNVLRQSALKRALDEKDRWIEAQIAKVRNEIEARQEEIILRLCRAGGYRDHETGEHILRMASYCQLIAEELGFPDETCRFIYSAAQMHDIGKIGIPDAILQKPGKLTPEERTVMQEHTIIGEKILQGSASPLIQAAEIIAATHHERWDGNGYPRGLKGEAIPIGGRIAAVADVFDALTSERIYKPAWPLETAREELLRNRGTQFDPMCVDAFLRRWDGIVKIAELRGERPGPAAQAGVESGAPQAA